MASTQPHRTPTRPSQHDFWRTARAKFIRYRTLFRKYWWIVAFAAALGLGIASWYLASQKTSYVSTSRMMVSGRVSLPDSATFAEEMTYFMATQGELMKDEAVRTRAEAYVRTHSPDTPVTPVELMVKPIPGTSLFHLAAIGVEPKYPRKFLDAVMQEYIATRREMRSQKGEYTAGEIDEEIDRVKKELQVQEEKLLAFQRENKTGFLEQEGNAAAAYLSKLNTRLAELKNEEQLLNLFEVDHQIARERPIGSGTQPELREADPRNTLGSGPLLEYERARQKIELLRSERASYARDLTPKHPIMMDLDEQIAQQQHLMDTFRKQSADDLRRRRDATSLEIRNLQNTIKEWEGKASANSERLSQHAALQSEVSRLRGQLESLGKSKGTVDLTRNVDQEIISVRQKASAAEPVRPSIPMALGTGLALGLLAGLLCLVVIDPFDDRIESVVDFEAHFEERVLANIPRIAGGTGRVDIEPANGSDTHHAFVESLRSLRSSLFYLAVEGPPPKVFLITSAAPNEGKSTIAVNFAITMAMFDVRVLLVDGDLRRGALHKVFDLPNEQGLGDLLNGDCSLQGAVQTTHFRGLSLLSCGARVANPGELFLGTDTDRFLRAAAAQFDYVVVDSAPITAADDTSCLAPKVDATLFVFRMGASSVRAATKSLEVLRDRQANILGLICNDVADSMQEYSYYRYSEYYGGKAQRAD